MTANFK